MGCSVIDVKKEVERLRASKEEDEQLMLDILRVLTIFHGRVWESEMLRDLSKIHGFNISYIPTPSSISRALERLKEKGLVELEERRRGFPLRPGTYIDRMIILKNFDEFKEAFSADPIYQGYLYRVHESIRRRLNE